MRRVLSSAVTAALVAVLATALGGASPAHASPGTQTTPPPGCSFSYLAAGGVIIGGYTDCFGPTGLHTAVAQCADGSTVYGYTEEMQSYGRQSTAVCGDWFFGYRPAVAAWGVFHLDH